MSRTSLGRSEVSGGSIPTVSDEGSVVDNIPMQPKRSRLANTPGGMLRKTTLDSVSTSPPRKKVNFGVADDTVSETGTLCTVGQDLDVENSFMQDCQRSSVNSASDKGDTDGKPKLKHAATFMKRVTAFRPNDDAPLVVPRTLREKIYSLFDSAMPTWSQESATAQTVLSVSVLVVIVISVVCFCVETLPQYQEGGNETFTTIEGICVGIFSVEFMLRVTCTADLRGFFKDFLNWIDLVSIMPWYVAMVAKLLAGGDSGAGSTFIVFRVVRLVRVFRVLKLSKYSINLQLVAIAVARSLDALSLLLFLIVICLLLFSSAVYLADTTEMRFNKTDGVWRYEDTRGIEQDAPFQSIPHAFWWCIVTLTTVGYGDEYPVSLLGKVIASLTMLCGILVAAFPVILIGNNFNEAVDEHKRRQKQHAELLQRVLGQEKITSIDDVPDVYQCESEMRVQFDRIKKSLESELERVGVKVSLTGAAESRDFRGHSVGDVCATYELERGMRSPITLFSYGNQPLVVTREDESGIQKVFSTRSSLVNAPLKLLVKKFNQRVRDVSQQRENIERASVMFQFRYEPLFSIGQMSAYADDTLFFIKVEIELDSARAQKAAMSALLETGKYANVKEGNVNARQLRQIAGNIPGLEAMFPDVQVRCKTMRPGSTVALTVFAPCIARLKEVEEVIPHMNMHFQYTYLHQSDQTQSSVGYKTVPFLKPQQPRVNYRRLSANLVSFNDERAMSRLGNTHLKTTLNGRTPSSASFSNFQTPLIGSASNTSFSHFSTPLVTGRDQIGASCFD